MNIVASMIIMIIIVMVMITIMILIIIIVNVPLTITITDAFSPYSNHSASGGTLCFSSHYYLWKVFKQV